MSERLDISEPNLAVRFRNRRTAAQRRRSVTRAINIARRRAEMALVRRLGPLKRRLLG